MCGSLFSSKQQLALWASEWWEECVRILLQTSHRQFTSCNKEGRAKSSDFFRWSHSLKLLTAHRDCDLSEKQMWPRAQTLSWCRKDSALQHSRVCCHSEHFTHVFLNFQESTVSEQHAPGGEMHPERGVLVVSVACCAVAFKNKAPSGQNCDRNQTPCAYSLFYLLPCDYSCILCFGRNRNKYSYI